MPEAVGTTLPAHPNTRFSRSVAAAGAVAMIGAAQGRGRKHRSRPYIDLDQLYLRIPNLLFHLYDW